MVKRNVKGTIAGLAIPYRHKGIEVKSSILIVLIYDTGAQLLIRRKWPKGR